MSKEERPMGGIRKGLLLCAIAKSIELTNKIELKKYSVEKNYV
jgi:hypothetical protein